MPLPSHPDYHSAGLVLKRIARLEPADARCFLLLPVHAGKPGKLPHVWWSGREIFVAANELRQMSSPSETVSEK